MRPGDVVVDLASGTGILGLLACRAGARRVYSIEQGGMIGVARDICRANGYADRVVFIQEHSHRVELPERADVVISDQIGRFGFEAGVFQFFRDARRRFLKPEGKLIPAQIRQWIAPVEAPEMLEQIEFWNNSSSGFNLRPARNLAANTGYPVMLQPGHLLSEPACCATLDLLEFDSDSWSLEVALTVSRAGQLHGIGGWFSAQLSPGASMTNSPLAPDRIDRRNLFLPIDHPVAVEPGNSVRVQMHIIPSELILTWKLEVAEAAAGQNGAPPKARFSHSTLQGMLLTPDDLRRTQPQFVPQLNPWGRARRSVLELCDGSRALSDIEQEVWRRHSNLFPSLQEAAAFVAEVVTRYSA